MPTMASSNIAHTAITDHRILRFPGQNGQDAQRTSNDKYPIVPFADEFADASTSDQQRDLGISLIEFASKQPSFKPRPLAAPLLDLSLSHWPDDMPAWEALGYAFMLQDRNQNALSAFEAALRLAPRREKSLFGGALIAARLGQVDDSAKYWK